MALRNAYGLHEREINSVKSFAGKPRFVSAARDRRKKYSGRKLFAVLVVLSHMFDEERRDTAAYCLKLEFVVDSIVCTICQFIAKTCNETAE